MEEMRRKLAAEREELLRERSRSAMARLEAGAQEKAWAARQAEADEEARGGGERFDLFEEFFLGEYGCDSSISNGT